MGILNIFKKKNEKNDLEKYRQTGAGKTKTYTTDSPYGGTSTTVYPYKAGLYPDFIPKSSFTDEEWERAVGAVGRGEGVFAPGSIEIGGKNRVGNGIKESKITPEDEGSFLDKVARFGVWPAVFAANLISSGVKGVTGYEMGKITTKQFTETKIGKTLGVATVAAELVLAGAVTKMLIGGSSAAAGARGGTAVITRTASQLGTSGEEVASLTTQRAVQALGGGKSGVMKLFTAAKNLSPTTTKFLLTKNAWLKVGAGLVGTSGIMTWLASDNIMQGVSIMTRDLSFSVNSGVVSREEALEILNEAEGWKNRAERFIKINSKVNPLLWPFGKILMTNAKTAQAQIDLQKRNIMMAGLI